MAMVGTFLPVAVTRGGVLLCRKLPVSLKIAVQQLLWHACLAQSASRRSAPQVQRRVERYMLGASRVIDCSTVLN